jgi:hypothetical protein
VKNSLASGHDLSHPNGLANPATMEAPTKTEKGRKKAVTKPARRVSEKFDLEEIFDEQMEFYEFLGKVLALIESERERIEKRLTKMSIEIYEAPMARGLRTLN